MRPSPPWDSRAATSRCRHAARNSSWGPALARGALGQPSDRPSQRWRLQRPGEARRSCWIRCGRCCSCSWRLSGDLFVLAVGQAEHGVVIGQAVVLDVGVDSGNGDQLVGRANLCRRRGTDWGCDARMIGPAAGMPGNLDTVSCRPRPVPRQAAISTGRPNASGDRVGVGVQADVVITRHSGGRSPTHHRIHLRQLQHRGPVCLPPIDREAAQPAMPGAGWSAQPLGNLTVEVGRAGEPAAGQE
jgi:hypothetical protein